MRYVTSRFCSALAGMAFLVGVVIFSEFPGVGVALMLVVWVFLALDFMLDEGRRR